MAEGINGPEKSRIGDLGVLRGSEPVGKRVLGGVVPGWLACETNFYTESV